MDARMESKIYKIRSLRRLQFDSFWEEADVEILCGLAKVRQSGEILKLDVWRSDNGGPAEYGISKRILEKPGSCLARPAPDCWGRRIRSATACCLACDVVGRDS